MSPERTKRRIAGVVAIGGGMAGLGVTIASVGSFFNLFSYVAAIVAISLYAFGVWAGIKVFEDSSRGPRAFELFQLLQVPIFQTNAVQYFFASLASVSILYRGGWDFDLIVTPIGGWTLAINSSPTKIGAGINILPLLVISAYRYYGRIRI